MFVILNPSLPVILSKAKDLIPLRVDSMKNLIESIGCVAEILRLKPQNDIVTQSPRGEGKLSLEFAK